MFRHLSGRALLPLLLLAACAHPERPMGRPSVDAPVVVVERTPFATFHSAAGTVRSHTTSTLSANVVGTVIRVRVWEGDRVRAGDVLVEIDARERRAEAERARAGRDEVERAIDAAAANVQLAAATYRRIEALHAQGLASTQEYDQASAGRTAAQAELARLAARRSEARATAMQADAVLDYSSVRAPIDGIVTARLVDPGAQAAPGVPLVTIEEERATRLDATVPESVSAPIGSRVAVEAGGQRLGARVARVEPALDPGTRSALVKLELERPLRAGTYAKALFPIGERAAVTVPLSALVQRGQLTSVFVVGAGGVARMRLVTVGAIEGGQAEVLAGLDAGETIVAIPARVRDGVVVRSVP